MHGELFSYRPKASGHGAAHPLHAQASRACARARSRPERARLEGQRRVRAPYSSTSPTSAGRAQPEPTPVSIRIACFDAPPGEGGPISALLGEEMLLFVLHVAEAAAAVEIERRLDSLRFREDSEEYEVATLIDPEQEEIGLVLRAAGPRGDRTRIVMFSGDDERDQRALFEAAHDVGGVLDKLPASLASETDLTNRILSAEDPAADLRLASSEGVRVCTGSLLICGVVGAGALAATVYTGGAAAPVATEVTAAACGAGMGACMGSMLAEE